MKLKTTRFALVTMTLTALGLVALGACGPAGGSSSSSSGSVSSSSSGSTCNPEGASCGDDSDCCDGLGCASGSCSPPPPCSSVEIVVQSTTSNSTGYDSTCGEDVDLYPIMELCDAQNDCAWVQAGGSIDDTVAYGDTVAGELSCCVYPSDYCGSSYYDETCDTPWAGPVHCRCNVYDVSATANQCPSTTYQGCSP